MKKKIVKIIAASGLAVMMGVGVLCGVLIAPMNSAQASVGGGVTNSTTSPLGLDPENDPVVYTTESGLDIKFHQTGINWSGVLESGALAGYSYVTMGTYNNTPINWVVIGMSESGLGSGGSNVGGVDWGIDQTPAGLAVEDSILNKVSNTTVVGDNNTLLYYLRSVGMSDELEQGELLMLSEGILGTSKMTSDNYNSNDNYSSSPLKTSMDNIAKNFTDEEKTHIIPQTINSRHYGWGTNTVNNALLFPLATNYYGQDNVMYDSENKCNQSFCVEDYCMLGEDFRDARMDAGGFEGWWLRSAHTLSKGMAACFFDGNKLATTSGTSLVRGVRPAFVLNLFA